ncbi:MAG: hypothetical protein KGJ86_05430 [Chloroflexota bacterium]|nr:hypothetical protein [Chloroflexota bacterium]
MMNSLRIRTVGLALTALLAVTYVLCVLFDLAIPGWAMYRVWQVLFPGFGWSVAGFLIGLVETAIYGFYVAVVFVPVYNYLHRKEAEPRAAAMQQPHLKPV